jgi:hypothetical protein
VLTSPLPPLGRAEPKAAHYLVQPSFSLDSPDLQDEAVKTLLQQAELLRAEWV